MWSFRFHKSSKRIRIVGPSNQLIIRRTNSYTYNSNIFSEHGRVYVYMLICQKCVHMRILTTILIITESYKKGLIVLHLKILEFHKSKKYFKVFFMDCLYIMENMVCKSKNILIGKHKDRAFNCP